MIFPAIAIALPKSAMTIRMLKMSILSEAGKDYVRTAYSRGNTTTAVMYKHVLKNAFIPVITFLGMTLSDIVAGSLIVEQVFSIPGLGRLLVTSISNRDSTEESKDAVGTAIAAAVTKEADGKTEA